MRLFITIFCFIVCCSCHNKSDLKRIAELEKENKELKEKIGPKLFEIAYESAEKNIIDSILLGKTIKDRMLECGFDRFYVYTNAASRSIKLNNEYKSDIFYAIRSAEDLFDSIYYTLPSKQRKPFEKDFNKMVKAERNFSFTPKDTGWYFCYILVPIKNKRTGIVTIYPITDSFYVYK